MILQRTYNERDKARYMISAFSDFSAFSHISRLHYWRSAQQRADFPVVYMAGFTGSSLWLVWLLLAGIRVITTGGRVV